MSRTYTQRTIKILSMRSGGLCAYPNCKQQLISPASNGADPDVVIGEIAHIFAYSNGGPRPNPSKTQEDRNDYENLIFLCRNHHAIVDQQDAAHSVETLLNWKTEHEKRVAISVGNKVPEVTSAELEVVAKALLASPSPPTEDFTITPPLAKMEKNGLTQRVGFLVRQGLAGSVDVEKYLHHATFFDPDFPERLKAGFIIKYNELQNAGIFGDELFEGLMLATVNGRFNLTHQAACLSILVYLFQKCEIFDK